MLETDPELGVTLVFLCVSADPAAAKLCLLLIFAHLGCSLQLIAFFLVGGSRNFASADSKSEVWIFREV